MDEVHFPLALRDEAASHPKWMVRPGDKICAANCSMPGASRVSAGLYVHKHGLTTYRGQWVQDHGGPGAWKQQVRRRQPLRFTLGPLNWGPSFFLDTVIYEFGHLFYFWTGLLLLILVPASFRQKVSITSNELIAGVPGDQATTMRSIADLFGLPTACFTSIRDRLPPQVLVDILLYLLLTLWSWGSLHIAL